MVQWNSIFKEGRGYFLNVMGIEFQGIYDGYDESLGALRFKCYKVVFYPVEVWEKGKKGETEVFSFFVDPEKICFVALSKSFEREFQDHTNTEYFEVRELDEELSKD